MSEEIMVGFFFFKKMISSLSENKLHHTEKAMYLMAACHNTKQLDIDSDGTSI